MKFTPLIAMLVAALCVVAGSWSPQRSEAAADSLSYTQTCQTDGSLSLTFAWTGNNAGVVQQWVDLSLSDNGWLGGTFIGNGPLAASQMGVTWGGIKQNATHYVRVNQQMLDGHWEASPTFYFTTPFCASGAVQVNVGPGGGSINTNDIDRKSVEAPVHDVKVAQNGKGGTAVTATVGLPSGCAKPGNNVVTQQGNVITVQINNTIPTIALPCTSPPPDYTVSIDLPPLTPGVPYEIHVNDQVVHFVIP